MMRKKLHLLFFFILILTIEMTLGKISNLAKSYHKKHVYSKEKLNHGRAKRALNDDDEKSPYPSNSPNEISTNFKDIKGSYDNKKNKFVDTEPFWGTRGKLESLEENMIFRDLNPILNKDRERNENNCKHCSKSMHTLRDINKEYSEEKREDVDSPFWGNRGRRDPDDTETDDHNLPEPFWGVRGRRQENEPFWGTRGRRQQEDSPFWGTRGRREYESSWSHRGRLDDSEPFWGNRGKKEDDDPFWGTRGRRQESEPFWGNRGKKLEVDIFPGMEEKQKNDLKNYIHHAISIVEKNIANMVRLKKGEITPASFISKNIGRLSKSKSVWDNTRLKNINPYFKGPKQQFFIDPAESRIVLDSRIYADEPRFILVERTSRSSSEDDPFFISRGKKYNNYDLARAARNRRGPIEELVKSVRNDPYYIARGKKDTEKIQMSGNSTVIHEKLLKAKTLICTTLGFIMTRDENYKNKREVDDNQKDRRTILKKLTAQLQNDPYFASRGKKMAKAHLDNDNLINFIGDLAEKCSY